MCLGALRAGDGCCDKTGPPNKDSFGKTGKVWPEQDVVARVLVVLSDGDNNAGEVTLERAVDAAQKAEVTICTISTNYNTTDQWADEDLVR